MKQTERPGGIKGIAKQISALDRVIHAASETGLGNVGAGFSDSGSAAWSASAGCCWTAWPPSPSAWLGSTSGSGTFIIPHTFPMLGIAYI